MTSSLINMATGLEADSKLTARQLVDNGKTCECRLWVHVRDYDDIPAVPPSLDLPAAAAEQPVEDQDTVMSDAEDDTRDHSDPIPPSANGHVVMPPTAQNDAGDSSSSPSPQGFYFLLKRFDTQQQILSHVGSFVAPASSTARAYIADIIRQREGSSHTSNLNIYLEAGPTDCLSLEGSRTFEELFELYKPTSLRLGNGSILIVQELPQNSESFLEEVAAAGGHTHPRRFLKHLANERNFPATVDGTLTLDYFGDEYYNGNIKRSVPHGQGTMIYHSGDQYTGNFVMGSRQGHGTMQYQNGDVYTGDWRENQQHGQGSYTEAKTGNKYTGGWRHSKKFGKGITEWAQAEQSEGLCQICLENDVDAAFYDCGHVVTCLSCARQCDQCPICRKRVMTAIKLFYA